MSPENGPSHEQPSFTEEEKNIHSGREHDKERAHAEARLINAIAGETIDSYRDSARLLRSVGQEHKALENAVKIEKTLEETAKTERSHAKDVITQVATINPTLTPLALRDDYPLSEALKKCQQVGMTPLDLNQFEYLAEVAKSKLQSLEVGDGENKQSYPVIKLGDTSETATFVTNQAGFEIDNIPRVFKISKSKMRELGMKLVDKTDFRSMYPEQSPEQPPSPETDQSTTA